MRQPDSRQTGNTMPPYEELLRSGSSFFIGVLETTIQEVTRDLGNRGLPAALWNQRPDGWTSDPEVQNRVADRLGWIVSPHQMLEHIPRLEGFAGAVRDEGFSDVVLLGMGGSSLAAEVLRAVVGVRPGWPGFQMFDSTDPQAISDLEARIVLPRTLFLLASKSGTTIEPNMLASYFEARLRAAGRRWNDHCVAITDEGTELHQRAVRERFREVFLNPRNIGGRYSALSYFGLVPAALMGLDIRALLQWGVAMLALSQSSGAFERDPAAALGITMAGAARVGRDKLTLLCSKRLEPFGLWVEQLVAESTGKDGKGVIPIVSEPAGRPDSYGSDRFFVWMTSEHDPDLVNGSASDALRTRGEPLAAFTLAAPEAIGAEFVRWEIATALAGAALGINPFDEPNVQQAKDATRALLERYERDGRLVERPVDGTIGAVGLTLSRAASAQIGSRPERFFSTLKAGDYVAILVYLPPDPSLSLKFDSLRVALRNALRVPMMVGYGPRYLHSTGQLHKGGPASAALFMITVDHSRDLPIPGRSYSFGVLERAQALGDFAALEDAGRRVLRVHLPGLDQIDRLADIATELTRYLPE